MTSTRTRAIVPAGVDVRSSVPARAPVSLRPRVSHELCTLFDVNYLPRGLALHASLRAVDPQARLRVFCMDDRVHDLLEKLCLPGLIPVSLGDLERNDPELAAVKDDRTQVEYCWTATPSVIRYCLTREPDLEAITYVDADVFFFSSLEPLLAELDTDSIQIVPHRYAPAYRHQVRTSGIYNVEWLTFRHDERARTALEWWRERCLEWCYDRLEDGKLGDQMYLDDWPERFEGVGVLRHVGGGLAPWNVTNYTLRQSGGRIWVDNVPLVFYHFHSLKLSSRFGRTTASPTARAPLLWSSRYPRSRDEERLVWEPYLAALGDALKLVRTVDPDFAEGFSTPGALARQSLRRALGQTYRRVASYQGRLRPRASGAR
jgi:hypothetical protein